jgi:hypothetical protein
MGAITVSVSDTDERGSRKTVYGTISMSNSYATGGDSFTLSQFGLSSMAALTLGTGVDTTNKNAAWLLSCSGLPIGSALTSTGKIQAWTAASSTGGGDALTEATSTTDLHLIVAQFVAEGVA